MAKGPGTLSDVQLPALPLEEWEETKETLHRYCQIVGKTRMELSAHRNHWWHVTLYVSSKGLTTGPVPYAVGTFEATLDLLQNRMVVVTSEGRGFDFSLEDLPVAEFYSQFFEGLSSLGIEASINTAPFDLDDKQTLDANVSHNRCVTSAVQRYHEVLLWTDQLFKAFAGRFNGKQSPVHLFWHSFDLALGRFSGRRATVSDNADRVTRDAYSHEVIAFGFWAGDAKVREPTFYSYTAPEPVGLTDQPLGHAAAFWQAGGTALLPYETVRTSDSPQEALLAFLESAYLAGARTANWDTEDFTAQPPR